MAKTLKYEFSEFEAGYFLAWTITSQCWNTGSVKISCGGKTLVEAKKTNNVQSLQLLAQGSGTISSGTVTVEVSVNTNKELKDSKTSGAILEPRGKKVGYVYDVCVEDGEDIDYNDYYINLVGWKSKG